ncbi:chitin deacetylase [Dissophora globulifera]|uniref:Chitin deacetylase n=1 Tax=Dissophora globulifera TaxID=979702 RepID=A0A9P6RRT9_9FUNG|nr:chitin deacetylase [Dissophora globulifera]
MAFIFATISVEAAPNNIPHKPDYSHPKGTSPWPNYGERPKTNTPEVKAWIKLVDWSKVPKIPVRDVESPGDPPECPKGDVPKEDCWWTCTGCFAPDDIVDCPAKNAWGLTFDDGPKPGTTENLLNLLDERKVTATFFVTGMNSMKAPWLLQETIDRGHHLASHTWSHSGMTTLTNEEIVAELKWTEKYIYDHTGYKIKYFRPPYGDIDNRVRAIARQLGFKTVIWSSEWDTQDWQLEEETITSRQIIGIFKNDLQSLPKRKKGVITLEHDGDPKMTVMARTLLEMGQKNGMKPMDIAQCLGDKVGYNAIPAPPPKLKSAKKPNSDIVKKPVPTHDDDENENDDNDREESDKDDTPMAAQVPPHTQSESSNSKEESVPGSISGKAVSPGKKPSDAQRSYNTAGLSVACWTLAALAVSLVL